MYVCVGKYLLYAESICNNIGITATCFEIFKYGVVGRQAL